jgi:hypothetical protein
VTIKTNRHALSPPVWPDSNEAAAGFDQEEPFRSLIIRPFFLAAGDVFIRLTNWEKGLTDGNYPIGNAVMSVLFS